MTAALDDFVTLRVTSDLNGVEHEHQDIMPRSMAEIFLAKARTKAWFVRGDIIDRPIREADDDSHFYGAWKRGGSMSGKAMAKEKARKRRRARRREKPDFPAGMPTSERDPSRPVYLRVGTWSKSERSNNYAKGEVENGVSVYDVDKGGKPIDPGGGEWSAVDLADRMSSKEPKVYVQGDLVGVGNDGEPLLKNVKAVDVFREADDDDSHFYGAWKRGGHVAGKTMARQKAKQRRKRRERAKKAATQRRPSATDKPKYKPGEAPLEPGKIRVYHYTDNIDGVMDEGIDTKYSRGATYGEPSAIWVSAETPRGDVKSFVEMHVTPEEMDIGWYAGAPSQDKIDTFMARGSNGTLKLSNVPPDRFVSWSTPELDQYWTIADRYPPTDPSKWGNHDVMLEVRRTLDANVFPPGTPQHAGMQRWLEEATRGRAEG